MKRKMVKDTNVLFYIIAQLRQGRLHHEIKAELAKKGYEPNVIESLFRHPNVVKEIKRSRFIKGLEKEAGFLEGLKKSLEPKDVLIIVIIIAVIAGGVYGILNRGMLFGPKLDEIVLIEDNDLTSFISADVPRLKIYEKAISIPSDWVGKEILFKLEGQVVPVVVDWGNNTYRLTVLDGQNMQEILNSPESDNKKTFLAHIYSAPDDSELMLALYGPEEKQSTDIELEMTYGDAKETLAQFQALGNREEWAKGFFRIIKSLNVDSKSLELRYNLFFNETQHYELGLGDYRLTNFYLLLDSERFSHTIPRKAKFEIESGFIPQKDNYKLGLSYPTYPVFNNQVYIAKLSMSRK